MELSRLAKGKKMLPIFLTCEVRALSPVSRDHYHSIASMWAGAEKPEELPLKNGILFSWHERFYMTFGESKWDNDIGPLTMNSRRAIGILGPWRNFELIATMSALPVITSSLTASLPKVLEKETGTEVISKGVRVKLGSFLHERYDEIQDQLTYIELLSEEGVRSSYQKGYSDAFLGKPPEDRLKVQMEAESATEVDWAKRPGVLALGLTRGDSFWVSSRNFLVQLSDVALEFKEAGHKIAEIMEQLNDYLDEVE